ncbi:MAG: L,D-transpeptidase family protein [Acidimicrobiales bacterium]|nr:L,D-transpeptidase family protein [Acidimicrobiales bacterium]
MVASLAIAGGLLSGGGVAQASAASSRHGGAVAKQGANVHARRAAGSPRTRAHAKRAHRAPSALNVAGILPVSDNGPISGTESIVVELSEPLAAHSPMPQISVPGTWEQEGAALIFQPTVGLLPSSTVSVTVPGGSNGLQGADGSRQAAAVQASWTVQPGSLLRADQLLATLGYLPVTWTPASTTPMTQADQVAALYSPPDGTFAWRYPNTPAALQGMWAPGADNVLLQGAVMAFEAQEGMDTDGQIGPAMWAKLLQATASPEAIAAATNHDGYTYTSVSKSLPESMTVWHNGSVVLQTPVNTGIRGYDTTDGTYPVYERLQNQVMKGTNPNGTPYADPVSWVAYFNGGDAVHYIARGSFGYPQSLGCVEAAYGPAQQAYSYLTMGSLVTVSG